MGLKTVIGSKHGEGRSGPIIPTPSEDAVIPDYPITAIAEGHTPQISLMEPPVLFHGKESGHKISEVFIAEGPQISPPVLFHGKESVLGINPVILYAQPGGGQSIQRSDSLDSSSESWAPTQVVHRRPSDFSFDEVAGALGGRGGGPLTTARAPPRVPRGDGTGVLGGGGSGGPIAPGSGNAAAVDGQVAINFTDYTEVSTPVLEDHHHRLIAAGRKATLMWFLRFLVDGVVLTCLENAVDLSNHARFGTIFMVYILIFACGVAVSSIRAELLEDAPFSASHIFELSVAVIKISYLVSLRGLHGMHISSDTKYATVYIIFKCVFSVFIKLITALAALKCLNDKLNLATHQD